MSCELFLAWRYLNGLRRQQPFVSVIALISVLGVALGVAALITVLAVMSGFDADLEGRIIGSNPHLVVEADGGMREGDPVIRGIESTPGVLAASPFLQTQALIKTKGSATGVILRGIDPDREPKVTGLAGFTFEGKWPPGENEIFLGSEIGVRFGWRVGDKVTVIGGEKPNKREMTVAGLFKTGMYDYDLNLALAAIPTVQGLLDRPGMVSGIGARIAEPQKAQEMKALLQDALRYPYWVRSWMDMNKSLFAALQLEKLVMFLILALIVVVACFNIIATILMMVVGKTKEVGILRAIGATGGSVRRIFTLAGLMIGFTGTALGALLGFGLCAALERYQFVQLPPDIYYIDHLPVKLVMQDTLTVIGAAVLISWAACLYPSWTASRLQPADALRYE